MEPASVDFTSILLVDSSVEELQQYTNAYTMAIRYEASSSTDEILLVLRGIPSGFTRIGFAFHYKPSAPFINNEDFFPDSAADLENVSSQNVVFMINLIREFNIVNIDFLACNTLQSESWRKYYHFLLSQTGVIVGASDNDTGNIKYGGDWVMESAMEDISTVYFTDAILNYSQLLALNYAAPLNSYVHTFYTVSPSAPTVMVRTMYDNIGNLLDTTNISYGGADILGFLSIMDSSGGGTNPFGIGLVDVSGNKTTTDLAYCNIYTSAVSSARQGLIMSYINSTYLEPHAYMDAVYTVSLVDNMIWLSTPGNAAVLQPALNLSGGYIYYFNQGDASNLGNTVYFSTTSNTYAGYYTSGVATYALNPPGTGTVNSYTTVSPTSAITLYCNRTKSFAEIVAGAAFYYTCRTQSSIVTNVSGGVTLWKNQNAGVDAVAIYAGKATFAATYPTLISGYGADTFSFPMIRMSNAAIAQGNVGFDSLGGAYQTGQLYEQTIFYFGYTAGLSTSGSGGGMLFGRPGTYTAGKTHVGYQSSSILNLIDCGNATIDVSGLPLGYTLFSCTVYSDVVNSGNTGTYVNANVRKFPGNANYSTQTKICLTSLDYTTFNSFNIGYWDQDVRPLYGAIGEVMYFNRSLTLPERQIIEGKIAWTYGVAQTILDNTHPYYSAPPVPITTQSYTVTYSSITGMFTLKDSNKNTVAQPFTVTSGIIYTFALNDASVTGTTFQLSSTSASYTAISSASSNTVTKGTPGSSGAYATIMPLSTTATYFNLAYTYYTVSVSGGVYWISTNGSAAVQQPSLTFTSGNPYWFDQSHISNVGYPLRLTLHNGFPATLAAYNYTSTAYTTGITTNGTPGSAGSNLYFVAGTSLYYYCTNAGALMGYIPPLAIIKYTFEIENGNVVANSGTAGSAGDGSISYINTTNGSTVAGTQTISYDKTTYKRGTASLYNNTYSVISSTVVLPTVNLLSDKHTYCFWMKLVDFPQSTQVVPLSFESSSAIQNNVRPMDLWIMNYPGGAKHVFMNFQNTTNYNYFDTAFTTDFNNTWKHLTITVDTTNNIACMYRDGIKITTAIVTADVPFNVAPYNQVGTFKRTYGSFPTNTAGFRIMSGAGNTAGVNSAKCNIDDYRIYDCKLTDAEILNIYQNANYNF